MSTSRARRRWTPARKTKVLAYYAEHGHTATAKKFRLSGSMIHNWKREREGAGEGPAPPERRSGQQVVRVREAIVYLEKAEATARKENSQSIRARIVYAMIILALATLRGEE